MPRWVALAACPPVLSSRFSRERTGGKPPVPPRADERPQNPRPILLSAPVVTWPSVTLKRPGYFFAHSLLACGQYCRLLPSTAAPVGMRAAGEADCRNDAPGQVRSCTQTNMPNFCAAAASSSESVCPLHVLRATPL